MPSESKKHHHHHKNHKKMNSVAVESETQKVVDNPDNIQETVRIVKDRTRWVFTFCIASAFLFLVSYYQYRLHNLQLKINSLQDEKVKLNEKEVITQVVTTKPEAESTKSVNYAFKNFPPQIDAKGYSVMDLKNDKRIYGKNEDQLLAPASITKIMTAIIAFENYDLSEKLIVPAKCTALVGSKVGFVAGESFTIEDLLYGLLVKSGADAACTLASKTGEVEFIELMNKKASSIGMTNTKFENEIGFDAQNLHKTTIYDLEKMSRYALKFSAFRKIVGTKKVDIRVSGSLKTYSITNTNDLLFSIPGTVGIKTGSTADAGECLSYLYENKDQSILIIILGSKNRFKDTSTLLDWAKIELATK